MCFEDNFKQIMSNGKGDSFAFSQKKKSKALNDCSKLSANLSKGYEGYKNMEDSKKKPKICTNPTATVNPTMKVNFSNKSLVQRMKKVWKNEDPPK